MNVSRRLWNHARRCKSRFGVPKLSYVSSTTILSDFPPRLGDVYYSQGTRNSRLPQEIHALFPSAKSISHAIEKCSASHTFVPELVQIIQQIHRNYMLQINSSTQVMEDVGLNTAEYNFVIEHLALNGDAESILTIYFDLLIINSLPIQRERLIGDLMTVHLFMCAFAELQKHDLLSSLFFQIADPSKLKDTNFLNNIKAEFSTYTLLFHLLTHKSGSVATVMVKSLNILFLRSSEILPTFALCEHMLPIFRATLSQCSKDASNDVIRSFSEIFRVYLSLSKLSPSTNPCFTDVDLSIFNGIISLFDARELISEMRNYFNSVCLNRKSENLLTPSLSSFNILLKSFSRTGSRFFSISYTVICSI